MAYDTSQQTATPTKPAQQAGGGATFFDSPALSKAAMGETAVATVQGGASERRKRGTRTGRRKEAVGGEVTGQVNGTRSSGTTGGPTDPLSAQATSTLPLKPSGSGRSVFDSPGTSKRSQPPTPSGDRKQDPTPSLKPNGRSVFELPVPLSSKPDVPRKKAAPKKKSKGPQVVAATSSDEVTVSADDGTESWYRSATLEDILDELASRFIMNLSPAELASPEHTCFQIEQAHWFYEDFIREESPGLPTFRLKAFCKKFIAHSPLLNSKWGSDHESEAAFEQFVRYKKRVPVCGAIMLNHDWTKVVLVKGWKANSSWGFPKGKMNNDEPKHLCAIREVEEETGYNCGHLISPEDFIEFPMNGQEITLFVVRGVPEDTAFKPLTRKEISAIEWFNLDELPTWRRRRRNDRQVKYFMIAPFVPYIKEWMEKMSDEIPGGSSSETNEAVDEVVHVDHDRTGNVPDTIIDLALQEPTERAGPITSHIDGQPSVIDDLFDKFTVASEKKEAKHGAEARQMMEESKADPAMQAILQKLMSHGRKDTGTESEQPTPVKERSDPVDSKSGKQQALMDKLMSSLGATPVKSPAPAHAQGDPNTPSKQPAMPFGVDQNHPVHHPYSAVNDGGFPVPTHNPTLAALNGHVHPAFPQGQYNGQHLPSPHFGQTQQHGLSHLTANLLNVLTPPRTADTGHAQYHNHYSQPNFAGNAPVSSTVHGPYTQMNGFGQNGTAMSQSSSSADDGNPYRSIMSPHQSNMQPAHPQSNQFSHLPGPIQLPLQPGMPELNRILPYQALPIRGMEADMGQVMHQQPPPQFQQMHPSHALSPPRHPASAAQAQQLLSLLNPREHVPVKSPPMSSAKTADGLLALLVGNNQQGGP